MKSYKLEEFFQKPFTFDRVARILFILLIIGLLVWGISSLSNFLLPFALAWLLAYLMMPLVKWFQEKLHVRPRWLAVTLVLILALGILAGIVAVLVPSINSEISKGWTMLQKYDVGAYLLSLLPEEFSSGSKIWTAIENELNNINVNDFFNSVGGVFSKGWNIIQSTFSAIAGATIVFIFLFYLVSMLIDYEKVRDGFFCILPEGTRPFFKELGNITGYYVNAYFRGQVLISLCVTIVLAIGFSIIKLPMGITLAIFVGLLNMIPYLQVLSYVPLVMLVGLQSLTTGENFWLLLIAACVVFMISDALQQFVFTPLIQGQSLGIHPVAIMLSLTVWGYLFGFLGLLFALPLTMIVYALHMKYVVGKPLDIDMEATKRKARSNREKLVKSITNPKLIKDDKKGDK